jgi:hypothetical protein
MDRNVFQQRAPVSCDRFWWETRHEYHLCESELKAGDPKEDYVMKGQEAVGLKYEAESQPHKIATLFSYPFSCSEITFQQMSAANIYIVQHSSRLNSAGYPNFSCP